MGQGRGIDSWKKTKNGPHSYNHSFESITKIYYIYSLVDGGIKRTTSSFAIKKPVWLWRRIINRGCKIQPCGLNNKQSTTLLTFTIWSVTFFKNEPFMSYKRFKKGGRVAKSPFLKKSVQKSLNRKIKIDFFQKSTFFELPITQKWFIFEESHISYGKRQKSYTLIVILVILSYLTSPIFNLSSKSTGFFFQTRKYTTTMRAL